MDEMKELSASEESLLQQCHVIAELTHCGGIFRGIQLTNWDKADVGLKLALDVHKECITCIHGW
jgi:hypothetical protein